MLSPFFICVYSHGTIPIFIFIPRKKNLVSCYNIFSIDVHDFLGTLNSMGECRSDSPIEFKKTRKF